MTFIHGNSEMHVICCSYSNLVKISYHGYYYRQH